MLELIVVAAGAIIVSIVAAYACIQYAQVKYGSNTALQNMEARLAATEKHVKHYNADRIRDRVHDLERRTGSGF